jgi:hypothetical protein
MDATSKNSDSPARPLRWLPSWPMDLWTAFVLLTFFVIRILASGTAQRVLARLGLHFANS